MFAGEGPLTGYAVNQYMRETSKGRSYCEQLYDKQSTCVGWASIYVSWALAADVDKLLEAIEHFCTQAELDKNTTYVWLCGKSRFRIDNGRAMMDDGRRDRRWTTDDGTATDDGTEDGRLTTTNRELPNLELTQS